MHPNFRGSRIIWQLEAQLFYGRVCCSHISSYTIQQTKDLEVISTVVIPLVIC